MKLFRDFHLVFTADGRDYPAESLARSITARPESVTITYSGDNFTVNETWFVPFDDAGAAVQLDIETRTPLTVQARFLPDMQMMWPAVLNTVRDTWNPALHAFAFSDDTGRYYGLVGSPDAENITPEHDASETVLPEHVLQLSSVAKIRSTRLVVIAGSVTGLEAQTIYQQLSSNVSSLREASAAHYRQFLAHTTSIEVPDSDIQKAYDWARVSMVQGMLDDPLLGTGLVAGYRTSGPSASGLCLVLWARFRVDFFGYGQHWRFC